MNEIVKVKMIRGVLIYLCDVCHDLIVSNQNFGGVCRGKRICSACAEAISIPCDGDSAEMFD